MNEYNEYTVEEEKKPILKTLKLVLIVIGLNPLAITQASKWWSFGIPILNLFAFVTIPKVSIALGYVLSNWHRILFI